MPRQPLWLTNPEDTETNPLTRERLLNWMASTGWIEGHIRKRMSPLDYTQMEDYIQTVWEQICLIPEEKLLEIYRRGKGKFTSYLKALIGHQVYSSSSATFKENKEYYFNEVYLDDAGWRQLENDDDVEITLSYPVISRDKGLSNRVSFEYEKIPSHSMNKLSECQNHSQS